MAAHLIPLNAEPIGRDVVEQLRSILAMAEAGEVSSVAIAYVDRSSRGGQKWSDVPNVNALIGSVGRLLHHLNKVCDDL